MHRLTVHDVTPFQSPHGLVPAIGVHTARSPVSGFSIWSTALSGIRASFASQSLMPYDIKSVSAFRMRRPSVRLLLSAPVASISMPEMNCTLSQSLASCADAKQNSLDVASSPASLRHHDNDVAASAVVDQPAIPGAHTVRTHFRASLDVVHVPHSTTVPPLQPINRRRRLCLLAMERHGVLRRPPHHR